MTETSNPTCVLNVFSFPENSNCSNEGRIHARGLCKFHYRKVRYAIRKLNITWAEVTAYCTENGTSETFIPHRVQQVISRQMVEHIDISSATPERGQPEEGATYALTAGEGEPSIANGDTWEESEVVDIEEALELNQEESESFTP